MWRDLRAQMLVASGLLVVLVVAAFAVLLATVDEQRESAALVRHSRSVIATANDLERLAIDLQTGARGFVITGEPGFLDPLREAEAAIPGTAATLRALVSDNPGQRQRVERIDRELGDYATEVIEPELAAAQTSLARARALVAAGEGRRRTLLARFTELVGVEQRLADRRTAEAGRDADRALVAGAGAMAGSALLIGVFAMFLAGSIVSPVRRVAAGAERLARGDLEARVAVRGRGEVAALARTFNAMAGSLDEAQASLRAEKERIERFSAFDESLSGETDVERLADLALAGICVQADADVGSLTLVQPAVTATLGPPNARPARRLELPLGPPARPLGTLVLGRTDDLAFGAGERAALAHLAGQAEVALAGAGAFHAARRQAAVTRAVLDAAPEGILLVDPDGRIVLQNAPMARLLAEVPSAGDSDSIYDHAERFADRTTDPAAYRAAMAASRADPERAARDEFRLAGSDRVFQVHTGPVRDSADALVGRVFMLREVSAERQAERMKDEFIALASHELRTPLTSIIGYLDMVLEGEVGPLEPEQERFLGVAARNADRLLCLAGDLVLVGQSDAGRLTLAQAALDLAGLARERAHVAGPAAEERGVALAVHTDLLPPINGDAGRLGQVLDNLISNALKFTPRGGRVDVRVARAGPAVLLEVADTGMGVPVAEQSRLFERFYRTTNARQGAVPGTGLGLSIVKAIVEGHGGQIAVESDVGRGTKFTVRLPLPEDRPSVPADAAPARQLVAR